VAENLTVATREGAVSDEAIAETLGWSAWTGRPVRCPPGVVRREPRVIAAYLDEDSTTSGAPETAETT
jgi:hypothetical protein